MDAVTRYDVQHDVCNISDHDPILLQLQLAVTRFNSVPKQFRSKPAWYRDCASEMQLIRYADYLRCLLGDIVLPSDALMCRNVNCCNDSHLVDINRYDEAISSSCLLSASHTIPFTSGKQSCRTPGWSEYVAPFKKKSLFLHDLWVQCGRSKTGVVSDIMRSCLLYTSDAADE